MGIDANTEASGYVRFGQSYSSGSVRFGSVIDTVPFAFCKLWTTNYDAHNIGNGLA